MAILVAVYFLAGFLTLGTTMPLSIAQTVLGIVSGTIEGFVVAALIIWNSRASSDAQACA